MTYTIKNLADVDDSAIRFGFSAIGEAHFARGALEADDTGIAYHVLRPNRRQGFAHRHDQAEEINVVISGGGLVKLDDEIHEIHALDAIRIAPQVTRQFEAGPEGMSYVVIGPHHERDGELIHEGFWD
ncbi:MAG TPA: cupin domain-containing protein [Conexibacter sp.]|jgi:mannose-6-phosphate isomerase-like protein (cupin superfamily)|nr:cupin domain-containing protein [Conexibacter sp.]